MAYNVAQIDTNKFSFGPGIVYIGAVGSTPTIDIGAVKGDAELSITRQLLEVMQGSPQSLVAQYAIQESVGLKVTGIEWRLNNLALALGAGVTGGSGANETLEFGGDMDVQSYAIRYLHIAPDGSTIDIQLFNAQGSGNIVVAMKEADIHEISYEFKALEASVDFGNQALASNKKKFKIVRTNA